MAEPTDIRADGDAYAAMLQGVAEVVQAARAATARAVNAAMTATYWKVGRLIVEHEQAGERRAGYGEALLERLSADLVRQFGRGFSRRNLVQMRAFYLTWPIRQTTSAELPPHAEPGIWQTPSAISVGHRFPLPWSHYSRLLAVKNPDARAFYEAEALRGGWTVRQLARQIDSQFFERAALSRNKAAMLEKGMEPLPSDAISPHELVRDPYVLEFLDLQDEYSENDLEAALVRHLETFLLELGGDFAFIGRQRRLRIGDQWFRVDLLFFHRRLRCLVVIDLKLGAFGHADAGQMHMYLNYAREHWTVPGENPPVGLILCAQKDEAMARYALEGLPNQVLAAEYRAALPDEQTLVAELARTRLALEARQAQAPAIADRPPTA